jgi:hypothetical protein
MLSLFSVNGKYREDMKLLPAKYQFFDGFSWVVDTLHIRPTPEKAHLSICSHKALLPACQHKKVKLHACTIGLILLCVRITRMWNVYESFNLWWVRKGKKVV